MYGCLCQVSIPHVLVYHLIGEYCTNTCSLSVIVFDAGRDWGQEEKGMTEDEMAGWHHGLDGHESE